MYSKRKICAALIAIVGLVFAGPALAKVLKTFEDALGQLMPGASFVRQTIYLDKELAAQASNLAGVKIEPGVVHAYALTRDGQPAGMAYIDIHRVRTLPEKLLTIVNPEGQVVGVQVLAFQEPLDYLPPQRWYDRINGKTLTPDLQIGRDIDGITGATLTTRAAVESVRRSLALHQIQQAQQQSK